MSTVLVTGAGGFVGRWLVRTLLEEGFDVTGAVKPGGAQIPEDLARCALRPVSWVQLDVSDVESIRRVLSVSFDAVVHLAAIASGADARRDPGLAWVVNAAGTARLLEELSRMRRVGESEPTVLVASTGEVYGARGSHPFVESDPVAPCSPYAASKAGAEFAALETCGRTGLKVIVARPFQQIGPGQDERYVAPALARRLRGARLARAKVVKVGNLDPVRDFLDVRDMARALVALLRCGAPGEIYNIATGRGVALSDLFHRLALTVGVDAIPEPDPEFMRSADIPYLVGDATKLRTTTGWEPGIPLDQTLRDLVNSQPD